MSELFLVLISGVLLGWGVGFGCGVLSMRRMAEPTVNTLPPLPSGLTAAEVKPQWVDEVPIPSRVVPVYRNGQRVGEVVME